MTEMELPRTFVERVLCDLGTTEGEALCRALGYGAGVNAADDEHEYQCGHYELGKPFNLVGNAEEKHGRYEYQQYH